MNFDLNFTILLTLSNNKKVDGHEKDPSVATGPSIGREAGGFIFSDASESVRYVRCGRKVAKHGNEVDLNCCSFLMGREEYLKMALQVPKMSKSQGLHQLVSFTQLPCKVKCKF